MGASQRKCIVLGNAGSTAYNEQNYNFTGPPQSVASCFPETNTRWLRIWADWKSIQPNSSADSNFGQLDNQIQAAKAANPSLSVILTSYRFPQWANSSTDEFRLPATLSRNSNWGNWIAKLYQRYDRAAPANAGIWIDALEVVNEPNLQCKPQLDSNGNVTMDQRVYEMFTTADQIGAERNHSLWLMGPALSDREAVSDSTFTYYTLFMNLFLGLGFRPHSRWIWTHHNYIDCETALSSPTNSAANARSKLIGKWSGYSDGDGPALFCTEGGSRLSRMNIYDPTDRQLSQRNTVVNTFERGRTGPQSAGIGMFANYLLYDDPLSNTYSGLRDSYATLGAKRSVYPSSGTTGFRYVQTGSPQLLDWRTVDNLGPWLQWDPGLASMHPGHLAAFAIGGGNPRNCWMNQRDGGAWSGWQSLGGECYSGPAAVSRQDGIMDLFVKGPNENIWATAFSPGWWGGWWSLGGTARSDPGVCSMHGSHLELFVLGPGNVLYHNWWYGQNWSGWVAMDGNTWSSGPSAVSMANGRMDVVIRGNDNQVYQYYFNGAWNGPYSIAAPTANGQTYASTAARVCSWRDRRLDVFARGPNGFMYRRLFDDYWGKWEPVGIFSGGPYGAAAEAWGPGHIDLITVESNGNAYRWAYE
jgi:hypothetical protein